MEIQTISIFVQKEKEMTVQELINIEKSLIQDEGIRLKPYRCTKGKFSIGVGRNLDDNGITKEEAIILLRNDIFRVEDELKRRLIWFEDKPESVKFVLMNMCFNLGINRLLKFDKTLKLIERNLFDLAADEMLDSEWAKEVKGRAKRLSVIMKNARK